VGAPSDIDRLIELGLNRYGAGDLDGALLMWEEALAIDPDNARASSYVDYVRLHYELLSSEPHVAGAEEAPFGIEEEPEYQIEIVPGDLPQRESQPVLADDDVDAGWFDEEATHDINVHARRSSQEIEIEAEPPPLELELEAEAPPAPEVNFDDATREYYGTPTKPSLATVPPPKPEIERAGSEADFSEAGTSEFKQEYTGGFQAEGTPIGFSHQETEVRKRDFGFVQPTDAPEPVKDKSGDDGALPTPDASPWDKPSSPLSIGTAPTVDTLSIGELTIGELTLDRSVPEGTSPGEKTLERNPSSVFSLPDEPNEDELLAGLPTPRPTGGEVEAQEIPISGSKAVTKELPDSPRQPFSKAVTKDLPDLGRSPARRDSSDVSQAEVMFTHAPTEDFDTPKIDVGAPTRELGIRPSSKRAGTLPNPVDEDAPTKQSDVRAIRDSARQGIAQPAGEYTRQDIALPFDSIDARAGQILDEIDADAPANESQDDQLRRRISALLERAVAWHQAGDTERAVCAVDLALNEDPNSALGQKLITRNRDTIMQVFQGYLGDLERQPQLALPLHELQNARISPRAAFLLSRVDGTLTIDELLDVSGMPRIEAFRHLCQLYLRGILR